LSASCTGYNIQDTILIIRLAGILSVKKCPCDRVGFQGTGFLMAMKLAMK